MEDLPDELKLLIIKYLPLRSILNLEQTNSSFRKLSDSLKGELVWQEKLVLRFLIPINFRLLYKFKNLSRSSRDYYVTLTKTFVKLGLGEIVNDNRLIYQFSSDILMLLCGDKSSSDYRIVEQRDESTKVYKLTPFDLNYDLDVSKYVLILLIGSINIDPTDRIHKIQYLWRRLPIIDNTGELTRWLYWGYFIPPTCHTVLLKDNSAYTMIKYYTPIVSYNIFNNKFISRVPLENLKFIVRIYDKSKLKKDLTHIIHKIQNERPGKSKSYQIPQSTKEYLVDLYDTL